MFKRKPAKAALKPVTRTTRDKFTKREVDSLALSLWAELHLPARPVFTLVTGRTWFKSQRFTSDSGFMGMFIKSYDLLINPIPCSVDSTMGELFHIGASIHVDYEHGRWMDGGTNGVNARLYLDRVSDRWIDDTMAKTMIDIALDRFHVS